MDPASRDRILPAAAQAAAAQNGSRVP
jgi:hypothetical protein